MGNTFWGRNTEEWAMATPLKYEFPFSRLNEFHRDQYNAWITGMECPLDEDVHMTAVQQEAELQFNCSPDFLPEAKKWFTAVTLANNHSDNQGIEGFEKTKKNLDKNGIQYFGHYDPRELNDICDVISIDAVVTKTDGSQSVGKLPIALCGYHGVFRIPLPSSVAVMKKYSDVMPVFAMPHMGAEYKPVPDQIKTDFYRSLIDGGADAVLGDHPHWVQSTESYKGHLIVYSMGNFMFDQQGSLELTRSAAIQVQLSEKDADGKSLAKWLEIGKACQTYHDDCLEKITAAHLKKLNISFQFGAIGTRDDNKLTKPATQLETAAILQRLKWSTTMNDLHSPYSSL
jgi:hypothetical protein